MVYEAGVRGGESGIPSPQLIYKIAIKPLFYGRRNNV
jgi:hypothetical protein